jgi:hypothetical protein
MICADVIAKGDKILVHQLLHLLLGLLELLHLLLHLLLELLRLLLELLRLLLELLRLLLHMLLDLLHLLLESIALSNRRNIGKISQFDASSPESSFEVHEIRLWSELRHRLRRISVCHCFE